MKILFNNLQKLYQENKTALDAAMGRVLGSGQVILGPEVNEFEKQFAQYHGATHAVGVANGLEALQIVLLALGIGPGDEVITTAHSAAATALSITAVGARPIFVDIDEFYHLDVSLIEEKITRNTKAILPVHLYGQAADLAGIMALAKKHNLHVIEDCAQAHGAEYKGAKDTQKVGTFGVAGCFSFYPTKNLGTFGDGGAIITNNATLADKARILRNYGQTNRYEHEIKGINSRLDELHASILNVLLPKLNNSNTRRQKLAQIYHERLSGISFLKLPTTRPDSSHIHHLFVIEVDRRDDLQSFMTTHDIHSLIH